MNTKRCETCGELMLLEDFKYYKGDVRSHRKCKACDYARLKAWRQANRERVLACGRTRRALNLVAARAKTAESNRKRRADPEIKARENAKARERPRQRTDADRARQAAWRKRPENRERAKRALRKYYSTEKGRELARQRCATRRALLRARGKEISRSEWQAILERFDNRCAYCRKPFGSDVRPTRDHVVPIVMGGTNEASNIVPACLSCNGRKGSRLIVPSTESGATAHV